MDKDDILSLIRSLLITKQSNYEIQQFLKEFKNETSHDLPLFGFKTPLDFLRSIPDIVQLRTSNHRIFLHHVHSEKSAHISSLLGRQISSGSKITNWSQQNRPECRPSQSSRVHSEGHYSFSLGNTSPTGNIWTKTSEKYLDCKNVMEINDDKGDGLDGREISQLLTRTSKTPLLSNRDQHITFLNKYNKPQNDVIVSLNELPKLDLIQHVKCGEYVEVLVSEVYNPYKFCLQLRRFKIKLLNLMNDLQKFYNTNGYKYKIPVNSLKLDLMCATFCGRNPAYSEWHRAVILKIHHIGVIVNLIDYGTVIEVGKTDLRFLHNRFRHLPPQAFMGCLGNTVPVNEKYWSEESCQRFLELVANKELIAQVIEFSNKAMWVSVALTHTDTDDELHINDELVKEELATFQYDKFVVSRLDYVDSNKFVRLKDVPTEDCSKKSTPLHCESTNMSDSFLSYTVRNDRLEEMFRIA